MASFMNGQKQYYRKKLRQKLVWRKHGHAILSVSFFAFFSLGVLLWFLFGFLLDGKQNGKEGEEIKIPVGDGFSLSLVEQSPEKIPVYNGQDYVVLMNGIPGFNQYDLENQRGESYTELDALGRCGSAMAMLDRGMMPTEDRGSIGEIKPTGWVQKKYPGIVESQPPYLYNRCHLIAYALTGQNANEKNLITGTRYLNTEIMLPWEILVMKYLDNSENHVLYRVTPLFQGEELVARGVEMEAYSVEDQGAGVCFHVFVYNRQPGIKIDYLTGESSLEDG